ncbi:hypothetical protein QUF74_00260 [Candidatus Halobeggiatoa sp. HSG11]|nr:hypothetical protein [Candidatus Halobeggiatoa sp. HSG11]
MTNFDLYIQDGSERPINRSKLERIFSPNELEKLHNEKYPQKDNNSTQEKLF